ncbi:MAG TPA: hypothetical protein EYP55_00350 [Anaerolineae bacterium]|nr:hypothetical protein [Anaerolineae bacterium]
MERVKQVLGPGGLQIPEELMERCGIKEGTPLIVELHRFLIKVFPEEVTKRDIEERALVYLLENVGDALGIGEPVQKDGRWVVPVLLPYAQRQVGELIFSTSGELLLQESSTPKQILEKVDAD